MSELELTTLHLDRPGVRAVLGDLEAEVMELVWQRPDEKGVTVREIWEQVHPTRPIMYTTVMNTMTRLARKGVLLAEHREPAYVYRAAHSREEFIDRFLGGALERLLSNFGGAALASLRQVSGPELTERLTHLLREIERRRAAEEPA